MQIKFSHNYPKLHGQKEAVLVHVFDKNRFDMTEKFIEYDTVYISEPAISVCSKSVLGYYPLPKGRYMVLLFLGCDLIPFTTARLFTDEKYRYCCESIGRNFDIVINEEARAEHCGSVC